MEGPGRFQCPPEFEAVSPCPPPGLLGGALGGPSTELWLIRAPPDFRPESLEGHLVPLDGFGQLQPLGDGDSAGDKRLYRLRGVPGGGDSPLLLVPESPGGPLACAPPLRGCVTVTQSFGPPPAGAVTVPTPARRKKKKTRVTVTPVTMTPVTVTPEVPEVVTPGRPAPGEGPGPPPAIGGEPGGGRRKKKHKRERVE